MREKIYFHHISHVMVTFFAFVLSGLLSRFLLDTFLPFGNGFAELFAFLIASGCAVLSFRTFEKVVPAPAASDAAHPVMEGRFKRRPYSMRRYVLETIPHILLTTALLILAMYLVTVAFRSDGDLASAPIHSPDVFVYLSLFLFHPLMEEYVFRGLLYGKLRTMSPTFACLMQAVTFAIAHNGVDGMMYALIAGIILGAAAERSNGIAVPVIAHFLINLRTFLCSTFPDGTLRYPIDLAVILLGALSAGILLLVERRFPSYDKPERIAAEREEADFDD